MSLNIWSWNRRAYGKYDVFLRGEKLTHVRDLIFWPGPFKGFGIAVCYGEDAGGHIKADSNGAVMRRRYGFIKIEERAKGVRDLTFFVDSELGDDANSGRYPDVALRTMVMADAMSEPGDTIRKTG